MAIDKGGSFAPPRKPTRFRWLQESSKTICRRAKAVVETLQKSAIAEVLHVRACKPRRPTINFKAKNFARKRVKRKPLVQNSVRKSAVSFS